MLRSKVALITGGAGGLGKAMSKAFLQSGAKVVACDINSAQLAETKDELQHLGSLHTVVCDLTAPRTAEKLVHNTVEAFGRIDILVNNAAIMDRFDPIGDIDMDLWDKVIATNLHGPARLSKAAIQQIQKQRYQEENDAAILNIGSINGFRGGCAGAAYITAKHALVGLTRNTAAFYANKGIRCNILMPGGMETNIMLAYKQGVNEEGAKLTRKTLELNPANVQVDELAQLAVFMCSKRARYLNGAIISADHGWQAI